MSITLERVEVLYEGWGRFLKVFFRLADGQSISREIEDHGPSVVVLPFDPARRVALLVRQFRPPYFLVTGEEAMLEVVAGRTDGEPPEQAARRELMEETGLRVEALTHVTDLFSMAGVSTDRYPLYFAEYGEADRIATGGGLPHEGERIVVEELALAELARLADGGALPDVKTFAAVQTLRLRRHDLFG